MRVYLTCAIERCFRGLDSRLKFASQGLSELLVIDTRRAFHLDVRLALLALHVKVGLHGRDGAGCSECIAIVRIFAKKNRESLLGIPVTSRIFVKHRQIPEGKPILRRFPEDVPKSRLSRIRPRPGIGITLTLHGPAGLRVSQVQLKDDRAGRLLNRFGEEFDRLTEIPSLVRFHGELSRIRGEGRRLGTCQASRRE